MHMLFNDGAMILVLLICVECIGIVKQNIVLSLLVKFAVLILAMFGKAPMWLAVFADVGVTVLAVLNSMRASSYNPDK